MAIEYIDKTSFGMKTTNQNGDNSMHRQIGRTHVCHFNNIESTEHVCILNMYTYLIDCVLFGYSFFFHLRLNTRIESIENIIESIEITSSFNRVLAAAYASPMLLATSRLYYNMYIDLAPCAA